MRNQMRGPKLKWIAILSCAICVGCGKGGSSGGASAFSGGGGSHACYAITHDLSGCCAANGGYGSQCPAGLAMFNSDGYLVCNDGTFSPTCRK